MHGNCSVRWTGLRLALVIAICGLMMLAIPYVLPRAAGAPNHVGPAGVVPSSGSSHSTVNSASVCNATTAPPGTVILASACIGSWPADVVFDAANGMLYAASENSQNVSVMSATTFQKVQTISASNARGIALDPTNGRLFISNGLGSTVVVVDTTDDNSVVTTLNLTGYTDLVGAQYDADNGLVYFLANNNADLVGVNPTSYGITQVIPVDPNPGGGNGYAIDPSTQLIYFPARGSDAVQVINESSGATETYVSMAEAGSSYGPTSTFLDPYNGLVYTMLGGLLASPGNLLYVFNPQTGTTVIRMTVGSWPNAYAYDPVRELLYVACAASGTISVINVTTNDLVDTIFLGDGTLPGGIAVDPATGDVFVGEDGTGQLVELPSVASVSANGVCTPVPPPYGVDVLGSVCLGSWPSALLYDRANQLIYASTENSENVSALDLTGPHVVASISTDNFARGLALDPYNGRLFVSDGMGDNVSIINSSTNALEGTWSFPGYTDLVGAQYDPTTNQLLLLANNPPDSILAVNATTGVLNVAIPINENPGGGEAPIGAVNPVTHVMYFAARGSFEVQLIDLLNDTTIGYWPTGSSYGPTNTFYDPSNRLLYVADGGWLWLGPGDQITVLNATTGAQVGTIPTGGFPSAFAYDPGRHLIYVSCAATGTVSVIDDRTNQVIGTISLGSTTLPQPILLDPSNGNLFVGESGTGMLIELPPGPPSNNSTGFWTPVATEGGPSGRAGAGMVYDAALGEVVLFGGCVSGSFLYQNCSATNDTWTYSGGSWTQLLLRSSPSARVLPSMVYDPAIQEVLLFGGLSGAPSNSALDDTWEFNGSDWTELFPAASPPASGMNQAMVYVPSSGAVVLFASGLTTGSGGAPAAYVNETWTFTGGQWTEVLNGSGPSPRGGESADFDAASGSMLLFGGTACGYFVGLWECPTLGDTWTYASGSWSAPNESLAPPPRELAALAYDPQLNGSLLFGGQSGGASYDDAWSFGNSSWSSLVSPLVPAARAGASMVYDAADHEMVLFGGYLQIGLPGDEAAMYFSDTWTFQVGPAPSGLSVVSIELSQGPAKVGSFAVIVGNIFSGTSVGYAYLGLPPGCVALDTNLLVCSPAAGGTFTITLTVTDAYGSQSHGSIVLVVVGPTQVRSPTLPAGVSSFTMFVSGAAGALLGVLVVGLAAYAWERKRRRERREGAAIARELEAPTRPDRPMP